MATNDWFCQFLADILGAAVERPALLEATAQGAAFWAGLTVGLFSDFSTLSSAWKCGARFEPRMAEPERHRLIAGWQGAVRRTLTARSSVTR
jgi:glycerol kinase